MAVLLPVHTDFVEWSSYKINGGSVIFTNTTNYFNTRYIDTTHLDLSVFTTTSPYPNYPLNIATFTLTVYLTSGATVILWSETTTNRIIGYTIPKKVYDLGQQLNISYISLTSSYPNIYFELWNQSKAYILISSYLQPNISASVNSLEFTYDSTSLPVIIPSSNLLITNNEIYTGNINWYVQSAPVTTPLYNSNIVDIQIKELNVYNSTNLNTQILINSNIYYNNNLYIVAVNSEGLVSQAKIYAKIMTYPTIINQGTYFINLTKNTSYPIASNIANYSGPVTWNIISNYHSSNISVSTNKNTCILTTNAYINQNDIIVTATNINNNTSSNSVSIIAAYEPRFRTPKNILQTITSNQTYTYNNIYISNNNTGPVIWYLKNNINGASIDYNTGALRLKPYINSNVSIVAQNIIGLKSSNTIYVNTLPTPFINITNININTIYGSNAYYQLATRDPSTNIQWNIQPNLTGVTLNTSGLIIFKSGVYISSNIKINAVNTLGCNITQNALLQVATNPIIINPGYQRYNMTNTNYNLQFNLSNNALGTGPITWSIVNSNLYSGISINSNNGLLTVKQNNPINTSLGIKAKNITNGTSTIYVPLNISQQPVLINPGNKVVNIQPSTIYNLQIYTSNNTYANDFNNLKWYIANKTNNTSNRFSITSITSSNTPNIGLFSVASNTICNEIIYIGACNLTGQSNEIQFNLALSLITDFVCPPTIYGSIGSIEPYTNIYTYQFTSLSSNIVSWNVLDTNSNSLAPLLTMNNTGLLTFNSISIVPQITTYTKSLLIVTTNTNNYKTTYNTRLNLELTPLLHVPNTISVSSINNTLYQLTTNNNAPIKNYYLTEPFIDGIHINSNNGLITFTSNIYYGNTIFGVGASNNYGSESRINIPIHIAQQPVLINPGNISCNLDQNNVFSYQIINTAIGTGPLRWFINNNESSDPNIPGLSITINGYLTVENNYAVNNNITITATNSVDGIDGSSSIYFNLKIGYTPILIPPPNNILVANTLPRKLYTYQLTQIASGTGNMFGSISNISNFTSSNISINNIGLITINSNVYINEPNMYTQLSNITGGYCNINFSVIAAQVPQFTVSPFIKTTIYESCNLNTNPYIYTLNTTSILDATSNVTWNILPPNIKGISYNSYANIIANCNVSTLQINYNSNIYLNCNISIIATNALGGCNIQKTNLIYSTSPYIINPYILTSNIYAYTTNLVYSYKFNINSNTGPLTWNIYPKPIGLNINSSGLLTYNSANAINSNIIISASNLISISCNINVLLNITQTPSIINPNNILSTMYDNNFTYQMNISNKSQCGITTWSLQPPIDNLSINSNTGLITFLKTYIINSNINVFATNTNNISNSVTFNLQVVNAPNIVVPANNQIYASILPDTLFNYNIIQSSSNTGPIIWSITDVNSNIINGVSISNISSQLANIEVNSNIYVNTPVIVSASNIYGGAASRKNINLLVTQIPILNNPLNVTSNLFNTFNYQISNLVTNTQPYTWYLENIPNYINSNISIDTNGVITVASNIGFSNNITVGACNILGSYCNISFNLTVTNTPSIVTPTPYSISNISIGFYDTFNYQMVNSDLRSSSLPLIWSFSNYTYPGLSITNDGLLTLQSAYSICNMPVHIEATNQLGYTNTTSFNMYILRSPLLIPPEPVSCNIYRDYNYQILSNIESNIIPSILSWSILSNPLPEALSITSNTGLITFSSNYNINETIYINASNVLGACNIVPFALNLTPPPVLNSINILPNSNNALIYLSGKFLSNITINVNNINQDNYIYDISISNIPYNLYKNNAYNYAPLIPNTGYNFNIIPYNSLNLQGNIQTNNIVTLPSQLTNIKTQITPYNCSLSWDNLYGAYTYSQISWSNLYNFTSSNSIDVDWVNGINANTSNYTLNNLIPNTLYNIAVTPYNYSNINGAITQLRVTTLPIVNVYTSNIKANSAIIKWSSISCNNSYNEYLSYSNISINIYGSNINNTYNFTSNIISSQYVSNLENNRLYTLRTTVYNNTHDSNTYLQTFNTLGSLPKLIVTVPSDNIFNISWGVGNYSYVIYTYNNYDGSPNTNTISDSSLTLHVTAYYTIYFTVTPYNNENIAGEPSSVYIQNNSGSLAIYYK